MLAARLSMPTPFGPITVTEDDGVLTRVDWTDGGRDRTSLLDRAALAVAAWVQGDPAPIDLPFAWGQGLDAAVRRALAAIPFGQTRTYGDIARAVGAAPQAVGQACGRNPLPILIPCHRVTGTAWFGGFSAPGGVETKAALLRHEGALLL
jgi:methylated-DNA-[protein]-cysteine S-methyltransferase